MNQSSSRLAAYKANEAKQRSGSGSPDVGFRYICDELEREAQQVPRLFDAVVIDEGQDLPAALSRLAYRALREPRRLYWAYDEAQGIGSLQVPTMRAVFGDADGPRLRGFAAGGVLKRCYRTPQLLLLAAQAVNMGVFRAAGALQAITRADGWRRLGYEVSGRFQRGETVELRRQEGLNVHLLDADPAFAAEAGSPLRTEVFNSEEDEWGWVAWQVARDLNRGLDPTDVLITCLRGWRRRVRAWGAPEGGVGGPG